MPNAVPSYSGELVRAMRLCPKCRFLRIAASPINLTVLSKDVYVILQTSVTNSAVCPVLETNFFLSSTHVVNDFSENKYLHMHNVAPVYWIAGMSIANQS